MQNGLRQISVRHAVARTRDLSTETLERFRRETDALSMQENRCGCWSTLCRHQSAYTQRSIERKPPVEEM